MSGTAEEPSAPAIWIWKSPTSAYPAGSSGQAWIRAEQVRALYRFCPQGLVCSGTAGVILILALSRAGRVDPLPAGFACALLGVEVLLHSALCVAFWRDPRHRERWRGWLRAFQLAAGLEGATWCLGALWLGSPTDMAQELLVALLSAMVALAAIPVYGKSLPAYLAFMGPTVLPHLGFGLASDLPYHGTLAALSSAYLLLVPIIARLSQNQFLEGLRLRLENMTLIEDLRTQKARADEANRTKSRFLAAASHDLRQPIHAIGLFVEALRSVRMTSEARRLVEQVTSSLEALDDLFTALLDISKLDAGVITASRQSVQLSPLFDRLRDEFAKDAAAKGLRLRFRCGSAAVFSDPVLLERLVRNLISNAIRYTETGGVVVGCRVRGDAVRIEVWDSGAGIATSERERIFEEFYQIAEGARTRSGGLGLGLSIVMRIAPLIGSELSFDSVEGAGSVFRVTLPRSREAASAEPRSELVLEGPRGRLIAIIDDEVSIQRAMVSLLTSWGHNVVAAGSAQEAIERLSGFKEGPDLLICDCRLREGRSGIEAVERVRAAFGREIPALLITGDTAADRLQEAHREKLPLLHKPLSRGKLRAAVGNLTRGSDRSAPEEFRGRAAPDADPRRPEPCRSP